MANKFWDTIKQSASKLFGTNKKDEQNSAGISQTSAAAASATPTTNNTPQYKDNSVVQVNQPGSGVYQYKSTERLTDQNQINEQAAFARQLGYNRQQTIELLRNGTRWKNVALGQNNRPIVSYQGGRYTSQQEIDEQSAIARSMGMTRDQIIQAMRQGTHWMEEPEPPKQLWEDESYKKQVDNRSWVRKVGGWFINKIAKSLAEGDFDGPNGQARKAMHDQMLADPEKFFEQRANDENFWGQFGANFQLGLYNQQADILIGQGVIHADQNLIEEGNKIQQLASAYSQANRGAIEHDSGTVLNMFSKDLAQYLPQFAYQQAVASPLQGIAALFPGKTSEAIVQGIGSGALSYTTMTGAAYNNLIQQGADPVVAARVAQDEAMISSIIESGDEFLGWMWGAGSALFGNNVKNKAAKEVLESLSKRIAKGVGKWTFSTLKEGNEELLQEMVSMASEKRIADGATSGGWQELLKYFYEVVQEQVPEIFADIAGGEGTEDTKRLFEAQRGGSTIGGIMGLFGIGGGAIRNNIQIAQNNRVLDNIVAASTLDPQMLSQFSDDQLQNAAEVARYQNRNDAVEVLNEEINRRAVAEQETQTATSTANQAPVNESTEFEPLHDIAVDNIQNLTDEQLRQYTTLLQQEIKANEEFGSEENRAIADMYRDDLQDAIEEGARRQNAVETEQAQTEESPQPGTGKPTVENATPRQYNNFQKATKQRSGYDVLMELNRARGEAEDTALPDGVREAAKKQVAQLEQEYREILHRKPEVTDYSGYSDEELERLRIEVNEKAVKYSRMLTTLEDSRGFGSISTDREELALTQKLFREADEEYNAIEEELNKRKEAQTNGSDQGNRQDTRGFGRQATDARVAEDNNRSRSSEELGEERPGAGRAAADNQASRDSGMSAEGETRAAAQRTGEQGNQRNQTVQRDVSEERSRRVNRIDSELERHFKVNKFKKNASRYYRYVRQYALFNAKVLADVFGSSKNASAFVRNYMDDPINQTVLIVTYASNVSDKKNKLTSVQQRAVYQAFASQTIIDYLLLGNYSAQDIADIGGFTLAEAESMLATAEQAINKNLTELKILNADGSFKTPFLRKRDTENARELGSANTTVNVASGESVGTAQSVDLHERYTPKSGDTEIAANNKFGNKIYKRGDTYLVVSKDGWVYQSKSGDDAEDNLRVARAVANQSSLSYEVASARLFANGGAFNPKTGIFDQDILFRKENFSTVQRSLASDEMNVAYSDMQKGTKKGTTAWFKLDLSIEKGDTVKTLSNATRTIRDIVQRSYIPDENGNRGILMANGKRYVFFGMTANGAKKGEAIMVDSKLYDHIRTLSLSGKTEAEVEKFNPAKYFTTSATIFSPSNANTGVKIAPKDANGKRKPQVVVIGDVFTNRPNTLRQFMRTDEEANLAENVDAKRLTKYFTDSMVRQLMENGVEKTEAERQAAEVVPNQVKEIIAKNDVGTIINIMTDILFQVTDGTGFINLPAGSPYEGQSMQMRSLGGFKAQLVGFDFSAYLHEVIPFNENAEYLYTGEEGEISGGFRYQNRDVGVEVLDRWGKNWYPVKDLRAILFDSTVKFAGEFATSEEFYERTGDADLRSIPRENVYGASVSDSAYEGYKLRGLGQLLRSQFGFSDEEVKDILSSRFDDVVNNILNNPKAAAKMFGVDFDGPPPAKADSKAYAVYYAGEDFVNRRWGRQWVYDRFGNLVKDIRSGKFPFMDGEAAFGWVDPDAIGLIRAMTSITRIYNQNKDVIYTGKTEGGGFSLNGYAGLTPGQIFNASLNNDNNDNTTVVGRYPSTKAIDVQIRENVNLDDPNYKRMVEEFGLDKANIYIAINDTLSMYLDNDYDGDPILTFQGALAQLMKMIRGKDYQNSDGSQRKKNVFAATIKGVQTTDTEALGVKDLGPVEFSHAKANKVNIVADELVKAVHNYLSVNDMSAQTRNAPKPVGMYDNMVERLAAIPDFALKKSAEEAGMDVKEYRALLEARFGVAYVLSIDYAKTGRYFERYFTLVDELDSMLYDIAEENGLISPREVDRETGGKVTKSDSLASSTWKYSDSTNKRSNYESALEQGNVIDNPQNLLTAFSKSLYEKKNRKGEVDEEKGNWFEALKGKFGAGDSRRTNWSGAMTNNPSAYQFSPSFYNKLADAYFELVSNSSDEFKALRQAYNEAHRTDVKDTEIKDYLMYKHFQQNLGLTNEQFTDLMLMMLSNTNVSPATIIGYDQSRFNKSGELSTKEIFQRNIALSRSYEKAVNSLNEINSKINTVSQSLVETRKNLASLLDSKKSALNAVDASLVSRIADVQTALEQGNERLQQSFNELFGGISGNAKDVNTDDLDMYRNTFQEMSDQISALNSQLKTSDSVFASGIADDVAKSLGAVDKEIRTALRQIDTLEKTLTDLYSAFESQSGKLSGAVDETKTVATTTNTGLEGLTEQQILDRITKGVKGNEELSIPSDRNGRREVHDESAGGQTLQQQGAGGQDAEVPRVDEASVRRAEAREVKGAFRLATDKDSNTLSVTVRDNGTTVFEEKNKAGKVTNSYTIANGGKIVPNSQMTKAQKMTQAVLRKVGIHIIYTTDNVVGSDGSDNTGFTFGVKDEKTGEWFITANTTRDDGLFITRHEPVHAFIQMLGSEKNSAMWMMKAINTFIANGNIKADQFSKLYDGLVALSDGDEFEASHEFFAELLSGDSFWKMLPGVAETFMRNGMAEYQKTGTFPILSDLINRAVPNATEADKAELIDFFTDPYKATPRGFARASDESVNQNAVTDEQTSETKPKDLPFGTNRKNIAKSSTKIQTAVQKAIAGLSNSESIPAKKAAADLKGFNTTVKMLLKGKATSEELYVAYSKLKGTLFQDETVDAYFDDFIDINRFVNEDAYNEAVDHALAKFAAHANQVIQAENNSAKLTKQSVKRNIDGKVKNVTDLFGSWQLNAPTVFKSLMGFKKGTFGYKLADQIQTANKNMQRNYWEAYRHIQGVAKMEGFTEMMAGKPNPKLHLSFQITGTPTTISTIEAINLLRMLKSVRYTQGDLSNVKGFTLKDGTKIRTAVGGGRMRVETIGKLYNELEYYFEHEATAVEKAYYKAIDSVFDYFTPEVQRVGKALNGYVEMIPADQYSPVSWGKGAIEENFDPKEAQLKADPRYMKARVEEAGGYLYAAPMNDVMETYIRRMSDYLAFGELREQMRIMNRATDKRNTKTLGQIAGENMGEHYARFVNNYVRDLIHYSENSDSFWYKARMLMQKGTLIGNPSVMMKQSASYLNAASVIDLKYLMRALTPNEFNGDYANGKSGLLEYRRITGNFDPTITDIFGQKASKYPLVRGFQNGISIIDHATVKRLYVAACLKVQDENPGLDINSKAFEERVEDVFSQAAIETQPQFDPSLRPENARTKNEGVRMLSMFRTQQGQNFNKLVTAVGEYMADKNPESRKVLSRTISGLVGSSLALALFTRVADALLHRKKKYRDEEGEITPESVANRIAVNSAEALAGTVWFGDDLAKLIIDRLDLVETQEFYGLNMGPVSTIYDAATALGDMLDAYRDGKNMISASKKFIGYMSQAFGMPLNNLYNYVNAVTMYFLDHMGDNPDDYDDWAKWMDNNLKAQNRLIRAAEAGNEKKTNRMWEQLQKRYAKPASELNEQLHKDYSHGNVSEDTAINLLIAYGGLDDEEAAKKRVSKWEFDKEHPEYKDMSESYVWKWNNTVEPTGVSLQTYYDVVQYFKALSEDKDNGKDNYAMLVYLNGLNLTDAQRSAVWSTFGSNFYSAYDPSSGLYAKFESYAKPVGITAEDFTTYYDTYNSLEADKDRNGKSISGSKKKKVIDYINSLPLSKEQKRALWKAFGYTSRSPW